MPHDERREGPRDRAQRLRLGDALAETRGQEREVLVRPDEPTDLLALAVLGGDVALVRERESGLGAVLTTPGDDRIGGRAGRAARVAHQVVLGHFSVRYP